MREKLYLLVVPLLLMATTLSAKQIDANKAKNIAAQFLQRQSTTRAAGNSLRLAYTATDTEQTTRTNSAANLFYAFDCGNSDGFVIVAGNDRMRPILGYTSNGTFDINSTNNGFQWWLTAISAKAKAVANGTDSGTYSLTRTSVSAVEPLVKTHWAQESPYNDMCPIDSVYGDLYGVYKHSVTGCVATAMSQILYYHYAGSVKKLSGVVACRPTACPTEKTPTTNIDLSQFTIDYTKMQLSYDGDESAEEDSAVATLMYVCGLSVNMAYQAYESSSNASPYVFKKYFGIDNGCMLAHRPQYTNDEWNNLIRSELDNGRPVLYSGQGLNSDGGHAFICDGYNSDGLWHINWGWGGSEDGYFDFYSLDSFKNPQLANTDYNDAQYAICGIKPGTSEANISDLLSYETLTTNGTLPIKNATSPINCTVTNISCYGSDFSGYIVLALCKDGTIVKTGDLEDIYLLQNGYTYTPYSFSMKFPTGLADGIYELRLAAGSTENDMHIIKGEGNYASLTVTVSNGKITVSGYQPEATQPQLSLESYTIGDDGWGYVNSTTPISLVIKNNGGEFLGNISGDNATTAKASIKAGETKTIEVSITPTAEGTESLFNFWAINEYDKYEYKDKSDYKKEKKIPIGSANIEVKSASEATPKLVVESVGFTNSDLNITNGDSVIIAVKLHNDGGIFKGGIYAHFKCAFISITERGTSTFTVGSSTGVDFVLPKDKSGTAYIPIDYSGIAKKYGSSTDNIQISITKITEKEKSSRYENPLSYETLSCTVTGIDGVKASNGVEVSTSGNTIIVSNTSGKETIRIYTAAGSLVKSVKAENGCTQIGGLTAGQSYIVSVNGKSFKIVL